MTTLKTKAIEKLNEFKKRPYNVWNEFMIKSTNRLIEDIDNGFVRDIKFEE